MIITAIELNNWQPYYGSGPKECHAINFKGNSGKKNIIVYGQNTNGKTAFWEAIQFAFFGRVNKRRSGSRDGSFKPLVADTTDKEPLLNVAALEEGNCDFGVGLEFNHEGDDYRLERFYHTRPGVQLPRRDSEMEQHISLRNLSRSKFVKNEQKFLNNILPEKLSRFFMFDGERANEYRDLFMEADHDVELRGLIEDILRFPILTQGSSDFDDIAKASLKEVNKFAKTASKDKTLIKEIEYIEGQISVQQKITDNFQRDLDRADDLLGIINNWLKDNDKGKEALAQEERYEEEVKRLTSDIETTKERMAKFLPDTWRAILRNRIDDRLDTVEHDLKRQEDEKEQIEALKNNIGNLERKAAGKPCNECGHKQEEPTNDEMDEIQRGIVKMEKKIVELEESRIDPDPLTLLRKQESLRNMSSELNLDSLVDFEMDILRHQNSLRTAKKNLKAAMKLLTADAKKEVANKIEEKETLLKRIGDLEGECLAANVFLKEMKDDLRRKSQGLQSSDGSKTLAHRKAELKQEIAEALRSVWDHEVESYREKMRARVEKQASDVFMQLTNKKAVYQGLRITKGFQIALVNKKGKGDSGSQGQWALIAYSILDALTTCSGTEFPLVIDTPGASIDDEHLDRLFGYLLNSGKQILIFVEGTELKPEKGDSEFAHLCAATYKLGLKKDSHDKSEIHLSYSNLE